MLNVISIIELITESINKEFAIRIEKIKSANNDLEPNIDVNGRLHAPTCGYIVGEEVYRKGEFISNEDGSSHITLYHNSKIKLDNIQDSDIEAIGKFNATNRYAYLSVGKRWGDNNEFGYLYVKSHYSDTKKLIDSEILKSDVKMADAVLLPEGKIEFTATLVKRNIKMFDTGFTQKISSVGTWITKEGAILYGTVPKSIDFADSVGQKFTLGADVTIVNHYHTFKRPRVINK